MKQKDVPRVESINITPSEEREVEWNDVIMTLIDKEEDGKVLVPAKYYNELELHMKYVIGNFVHEN